MRGPVFLTAIAALGCREIAPAPTEQQALMQFFFTEFEDASDETLAEAFRNFDEAVDGAHLEYSEGIVENLSVRVVLDARRIELSSLLIWFSNMKAELSCEELGMPRVSLV